MIKGVVSVLLVLGITGASLETRAAETAPSAASATATPQPRLPDTIMFTIDEYNDIQNHLARSGGDEDKGDSHRIENASLYLSTILYMGPQDWTIWVNGVPIGPRDEFAAFKVTDISAQSVELLVPLSAQGVRPVRLGPNQSFITKTGIVVEGRAQ